MGHHSQICEFLITLTHAQNYKFLHIQKLNYTNICTGYTIVKSNHDAIIGGGRESIIL